MFNKESNQFERFNILLRKDYFNIAFIPPISVENLGKVESELFWKDFPYPSSKTWLDHFLQYFKSAQIQIQCVYKVGSAMQSNLQRETQLEKQ